MEFRHKLALSRTSQTSHERLTKTRKQNPHRFLRISCPLNHPRRTNHTMTVCGIISKQTMYTICYATKTQCCSYVSDCLNIVEVCAKSQFTIY